MGNSQPMNTRTLRLDAEDLEGQHAIFGTDKWRTLQTNVGLSTEEVDFKFNNLLAEHKKWIDAEEVKGQKLLEEYKVFYKDNDKALHTTLFKK